MERNRSRRNVAAAAAAGAAWGAAGEEASRAAVEIGAEHVGSAKPDAMRRALKAALDKRGDDIFLSWRGMSPEARASLLKTVSPHMPRWAGDQDSGGRGESRGACAMCPELSVRELSQDPERLVQLLREWSSTDELYVKDNADLHLLRRSGALQSADFAKDDGIIITIDGETRGQKLQLTAKGASQGLAARFEHYVNSGAGIPIRAYYKVTMRQSSILQVLVMVVDEVRSEILERRPHMTSIQARGCASCGAQVPKLMQCAGCKIVGYCSKPCQVADWRSHKGFCKAHRGLS